MESLLEGFEKKQSRSSSAKVAFGHFPMSFTASSESGRRGILIHTKFANHVWASGGALAERTSFGSGKSRTGELSLDRIRAVFSKGADYCCELVWRRLNIYVSDCVSLDRLKDIGGVRRVSGLCGTQKQITDVVQYIEERLDEVWKRFKPRDVPKNSKMRLQAIHQENEFERFLALLSDRQLQSLEAQENKTNGFRWTFQRDFCTDRRTGGGNRSGEVAEELTRRAPESKQSLELVPVRLTTIFGKIELCQTFRYGLRLFDLYVQFAFPVFGRTIMDLDCIILLKVNFDNAAPTTHKIHLEIYNKLTQSLFGIQNSTLELFSDLLQFCCFALPDFPHSTKPLVAVDSFGDARLEFVQVEASERVPDGVFSHTGDSLELSFDRQNIAHRLCRHPGKERETRGRETEEMRDEGVEEKHSR
ncbi:hypothetical protein SELMODRAFT_432554 [Selaginella moellendorffii]|uniref:Uncharacterized protein n=1 Tax=Selaginella moellendorffii TaxID=88036 RepID=D8TGD0_SELML|nr:hypothetical protein SELMODRAFT_432554 [Selaginella moellendorffii]